MGKRTRWQPPHPDPTKAYQVHQNAEKVSARLQSELRKYIRCVATGCTRTADERAIERGVNLCEIHAYVIVTAFPPPTTCRECDSRAAEEALLRAERAKANTAEGVIYYLAINGEIKIGWTSNLHRRMRDYPPSAELLATEPGTKTLERARHQQFNEYLTHGREWFETGRFLLEHIDTLVEKHGEPPTIATLSTPMKATEPSTLKVRGTAYRRRKHDGSAAVKRPAA